MDMTAHPAGVRLFFQAIEERGISATEIKGAAAALKLCHSAERVPACTIIDLLEQAAHVTQDEAFGLSYAQMYNVRRLGPMGLMWEHSQNLAEGLRITQRYLHVMNEAVAMKIDWDVDEVAMVYTVAPVSHAGARHFMEALLATAVRLIRRGLGSQWAPVRVELEHSSPAKRQVHAQFFRSDLKFGAYRNALVCKTDDLLKSFKQCDVEILDVIKRNFEEMDANQPREFMGRVERVITTLMPGGRASLASVAGHLSIEPRTLQRRLKEHGIKFSDILLTLRARRAAEYFRQEPYPRLAHLAHLLGYSDVSTTARFLQSKAGIRHPRSRSPVA